MFHSVTASWKILSSRRWPKTYSAEVPHRVCSTVPARAGRKLWARQRSRLCKLDSGWQILRHVAQRGCKCGAGTCDLRRWNACPARRCITWKDAVADVCPDPILMTPIRLEDVRLQSNCPLEPCLYLALCQYPVLVALVLYCDMKGSEKAMTPKTSTEQTP